MELSGRHTLAVTNQVQEADMTILGNRALLIVLLTISAVVTWNVYVTTVRVDSPSTAGGVTSRARIIRNPFR